MQSDELLQIDLIRENLRHVTRADVRIVREDGEYSETVAVDISESGVKLDGLTHFPENTRVTVEFPNGLCCAAKVVWRDDHNSGLEFEVPLNVFQFARLRCELWTSLDPSA